MEREAAVDTICGLAMDARGNFDSPEVRGPWAVARLVRDQLSGGSQSILARVVVVAVPLLARPCQALGGWLGWMANGSQHMTIGRACYRCHGWARSLEAGPKFLGATAVRV